jgi:hypothetical protein
MQAVCGRLFMAGHRLASGLLRRHVQGTHTVIVMLVARIQPRFLGRQYCAVHGSSGSGLGRRRIMLRTHGEGRGGRLSRQRARS